MVSAVLADSMQQGIIPKQIGFDILIRYQDSSISKHDLYFEEAIDGEPIESGQPALSPTQR